MHGAISRAFGANPSGSLDLATNCGSPQRGASLKALAGSRKPAARGGR